jgi:hypothetical protein
MLIKNKIHLQIVDGGGGVVVVVVVVWWWCRDISCEWLHTCV